MDDDDLLERFMGEKLPTLKEKERFAHMMNYTGLDREVRRVGVCAERISYPKQSTSIEVHYGTNQLWRPDSLWSHGVDEGSFLLKASVVKPRDSVKCHWCGGSGIVPGSGEYTDETCEHCEHGAVILKTVELFPAGTSLEGPQRMELLAFKDWAPLPFKVPTIEPKNTLRLTIRGTWRSLWVSGQALFSGASSV